MSKTKNQNFSPVKPVLNPYDRARNEYDNLIGTTRLQSQNWKRISLSLIFLLALSISNNIYLSSKSAIQAYVIEVEHSGMVKKIGVVEESIYQPKLAAIKYFLTQFITDIRTIPDDMVLLKKQHYRAFNFVTPRGYKQLKSYEKKFKPFSLFQKQIVSIEFKSILESSERSYQVKWKETIFFKDHQPVSQLEYSGIFSIEIHSPTSDVVLNNNPLGIFIDFFSISKDIN